MSHGSEDRDDRAGLPSGSKAEQWTLCPGSHAAQAGLVQQSSEDAAEGTDLHLVMEYHERDYGTNLLYLPELPYLKDRTEEQRETLARTIRLRNEAVETVAAIVGWPVDAAPAKLSERRLWLRDADTLDTLSSARLDLALVVSNTALVLDYKFGRGDVEPAPGNLQLRMQALCLAQEQPELSQVFVGIVAPRAADKENALSLARYTAADLRFAYAETAAAARRAVLPNQPRVAGLKQCKYCLAAGTERCPESRAVVGAALLTANSESALACPVTCEELDRIVLAEKMLEKYAEARKQQAKDMLAANPDAIPGWSLKPGRKSAKVADASAAYARVCDKMGAASFAKACKVSLLELAVEYKSAAGHSSVNAAREDLEAVLGDLIERGQSAPTLERSSA